MITITRKFNTDDVLNTTDCVAVASKLPVIFTYQMFLLTYLRYSSVPTAINSFNVVRLVTTCPGSHRHTSLTGIL